MFLRHNIALAALLLIALTSPAPVAAASEPSGAADAWRWPAECPDTVFAPGPLGGVGADDGLCSPRHCCSGTPPLLWRQRVAGWWWALPPLLGPLPFGGACPSSDGSRPRYGDNGCADADGPYNESGRELNSAPRPQPD